MGSEEKYCPHTTSTHILFRQLVIVNEDIGRHNVRVVLIRKLGITQGHGQVKVLGLDGSGECIRLLDGLHERLPHDFVLVDGDKKGLRLRGGFDDGLDSLHALQGGKNAVVGDGCSAALDVAQRRNAGVETETALATIRQQVLDLRRGNLGAVLVASSLGDDDDRLAFAVIAMLSPSVQRDNCQSRQGGKKGNVSHSERRGFGVVVIFFE